MSTTPITFENDNIEYTLIGGPEKSSKPMEPEGFTILLLSRGGKPFRHELIRELKKLNCREIIFVEENKTTFKPDETTSLGENIHTLRVKGSLNPGDLINIGIKESSGKFVFVLWSDMVFQSHLISSRVFEKIDERNNFCTVPILTEEDKVLPTCSAPIRSKAGHVEVIFHSTIDNQVKTLFPSDFCGIYQRDKFLRLGGYDGKIRNPYWQLMDLGFRTALWGDKITFQSALKLSYLGEVPPMNISTDRDYGHFFMKTQAIKVSKGRARLPGYRLIGLLLKTRGSAVDVINEFRQIRAWVRQNRKQFKEDIFSLLNHWEES